MTRPTGWSIIDMHVHIWQTSSVSGSCANDERTLLEMADRYNIEALVVMPLFGGICPTRDDITAGNTDVAEFTKRDKRVKPMVYVYPRHGQFALDEINRWMGAGFEGLKIWVNYADEPAVYPLIERMIELDKPTIIHAMQKTVGQLPLESNAQNIANLAERYPEAKLIMPHLGGNFFYSCELIAPHRNVFADPCGTFCETGMLEHAVDVLGEDRVMFGTDAPGADFVNNLAKVVAADLSPRAMQKILSLNARRLWGWK